ncbi:MAG: MaoC/PaaZ C-terminal domain-containing protein [Acidimicrobiia bacterium]
MGAPLELHAVGEEIVTPLLVDDNGDARALTRSDFVRYAGASGDFNPMHHDEVVAQAAGQPSVFGHGMFTAGLVARVLVEQFGSTALQSFAVRFTQPTRPDEVLMATLRVRDVRRERGTDVLEIVCAVHNQAGECKMTGSAVVGAGEVRS